MNWNLLDYLYGVFLVPNTSNKIAAFDLDDTLIKTRSKKSRPIDNQDWMIAYDNIIPKIKKLHVDNYRIVIISNQKGISKTNVKLNEWKEKIDNIVKLLNVPIEVFCSLQDDEYRKPKPTWWNLIDANIDKSKSFFCGDAYCNTTCFANTDYTFALNGGITFYTPDEYFQNLELDNVKLIHDRSKWNIKYEIHYLLKNATYTEFIHEANKLNKKELIMLVGYPGSGKSTLAKYFDKIGYTIINQDICGTKAKCIKTYNLAIKNNQNIVIDNTNTTKEHRKDYLDLALINNYLCVCIEIKIHDSIEVFKHNVNYRNYKSQGKNQTIPSVVYYTMRKKYKTPTVDEGFSQIRTIDALSLFDKTTLDKDYYLFLL